MPAFFTMQLKPGDQADLDELVRLLYERRILPTAQMSEATRWAWRFVLAKLREGGTHGEKA